MLSFTVSEQFCVLVPRPLALDTLYRLDAAQSFENSFWGSHKFVFRKFEFLTELGSETKKRFGAAELRSF